MTSLPLKFAITAHEALWIKSLERQRMARPFGQKGEEGQLRPSIALAARWQQCRAAAFLCGLGSGVRPKLTYLPASEAPGGAI